MSYYDRDDVEDVGDDIGEATIRRPPFQANRPRPYIPPRPPTAPVTGPQVFSAFDRVGTDVRSLAEQLREIEQRVEARQSRMNKALSALESQARMTAAVSAAASVLEVASKENITLGQEVLDKDGKTALPAGTVLSRSGGGLETAAYFIPLAGLFLTSGTVRGGLCGGQGKQGGITLEVALPLAAVGFYAIRKLSLQSRSA